MFTTVSLLFNTFRSVPAQLCAESERIEGAPRHPLANLMVALRFPQVRMLAATVGSLAEVVGDILADRL